MPCTIAQEQAGSLDALRGALYPPRGGLHDELLQKVPRAAMIPRELGTTCEVCVCVYVFFWLHKMLYTDTCDVIDVPMSSQGMFGIMFDPSCGWSSNLNHAWEAPFKWRHAGLSEIHEFLLNEQKLGRYKPILDLNEL